MTDICMYNEGQLDDSKEDVYSVNMKGVILLSVHI